MTEPTDDEIATLYAEQTGFALDDGPAALLDFARAVLAKWGTPPAVAGEPVAWRHRMGPTDIWVECSKEFHDWVVREPSAWPRDEVQALCIATPQPTQAQAGAVPLTRERVKAILTECGYDGASAQHRADFINGLRHGEAAHGIKGGQHVL